MVTKTEMAFGKLLRAFKKKRATVKRLKNGKLRVTAGWDLDLAYGGVKVVALKRGSTGEYDLFDRKRRSPAQFVKWVDVVTSAKRQR